MNETYKSFLTRNNEEYFPLQPWAWETAHLPMPEMLMGGFIKWNAQNALASLAFQIMTMEQEGLFFTALNVAHQREDEDFLQCAMSQYPDVILGYKISRFTLRRRVPENVRLIVLAAGECLLCGRTDRLTVDHIKPVSRGGTNALSNLQCLCHWCNSRKSNKWVEKDDS